MADRGTRWKALSGRTRIGSVLVASLAVAVAAVALWRFVDWRPGITDAEARFEALAAAGEGSLARVERIASFGTRHLRPGQTAYYRHRFPTSGPHDPMWIDPGYYETVQSPNKLVHSIERGMIVIYYDMPPAEVLALLRDWVALHDGPWSGLVVVPMPGIGGEVVLTAWNHLLRLDPFEAAVAAAFIRHFRGRGPKSPER